MKKKGLLKKGLFTSFVMLVAPIMLHGMNVYAAEGMNTNENGVAYYEDSQGVRYGFYDDGETCYVGDYADTISENIIIPETITVDGKEYTVTTIAKDAFDIQFATTFSTKLDDVVSIELPNTITTIEYGALDLSMLDTSNVTGMQEMFYECRNLKSVDLSGFNTSKVTDMIRMFMYCTSLESLDLSNFKTNSLEDMIEMFCMCQSLDVLDLSGFDLSNTQAEWTFGNFIYEHEGMVLKTPVNYKGTTKFFYNSDSFGNEGEFFLWTDGDGKIYDSLPNLPHSVTLTLKSYPADYFYEDISPKKKNTVMTISSKKCKVKVTSSSMNNPTVTYMKSTNSNATSITIPDKVTVDEITYKVTAVSSKAFKNNKKLKSVTIGKNVKTIGKEAFYNCKKLKKITIKSSALKSVEKNAIKNIEKKATIKVPKSKLKKYKSLFKSKTGYKKTMKIKK